MSADKHPADVLADETPCSCAELDAWIESARTAWIESTRTELRRIPALEKLAAERLEQMTADRKQALQWRDERDALRAEVEQARASEAGALDLVSRVRFALGDNGRRTQDDLLAYCSELAERDPNAPWLSVAHALCADLGIPPGNLFDRLAVARDKIAEMRAAAPRAQALVWIRPDDLHRASFAPHLCRIEPDHRDDFVPLYTAPHPAEARQPLTDAAKHIKAAMSKLESAMNCHPIAVQPLIGEAWDELNEAHGIGTENNGGAPA